MTGLKHGYAVISIIFLLLATACGSKESAEKAKRRKLFIQILQQEDERSFISYEYWRKLLLENPDPWLWERVLLALGRIGDPRAIPLLRDWMLNSSNGPSMPRSVAIRQMAAFAIGEIEDKATLYSLGVAPDPTAVPMLCALLNDPAIVVRGRAAEALGKIADKQAVGPILGQLPDPHKELSPYEKEYVGLLLTALFRLQDVSVIDRVTQLAENTDPEVRWQTAHCLYRLLLQNPGAKTEEVKRALLPLLRDPYPPVRAQAVRALGATLDKSLVSHIAPLIQDKDFAAQVETANALGRLQAGEGVQPLLDKWNSLEKALKESRQPKLKNSQMVIVQALGEIGDKRSIDLLNQIRFKPDPVSYAAEVALAKILKGDDAFFGAAQPGEEQPARGEIAADYWRHFNTPEGLRACATALGEHGSHRAQNVLLDLLRQEQNTDYGKLITKAKPAILNSLVKLHPNDLEDILIGQLRDADEVVRKTAAEGLGALQEKNTWSAKALGALAESYAYADKYATADARLAIVTALGRFGREEAALRTLTAALTDRERNVRIRAAQVLKKTTGVDYFGYIGKAVTRNSDTVYTIATDDQEKNTIARMQTARGEIQIKLFRRDAPLTVHNFIRLANSGFYDHLTFMRVVPNFVIQGGDPRNDQEGGPGYTIRCEINQRPFVRGSVGMALDGKDTGGSQFFICLSPQPHLDGGYTNFGQVIAGMEVAENIMPVDEIRNVTIKEIKSLWGKR